MKGKYRKIYLFAFTVFIFINIAAIFIVFKKYRNHSNTSMLVSKTKFNLAKLKEKIEKLEDKLPVNDSILIGRVDSIKMNQVAVDSLLRVEFIDNQTLSDLAIQIASLSHKSSEIEKSLDALVADSNSEIHK